jgi:hypothetical protein
VLHSTRATRTIVIMIIAVFSAMTVSATIFKGTSKTSTASVRAVKKTGSPEPSKDAACRSKFRSLLGKVATTAYAIDTQTKIMSANVKFEGQSYDLSALGLASSYSFGKFFNPPQPPLNLYSVLFSLNLQGKNPVNSFMYVLDNETNCIVSSAANPFKTAPASKFGQSGN